MLSPGDEAQLQATARALGMQRDWLYNTISLESAWNPRAYNPSGAVGLIQFMPKTLRGMGVLSSRVAALVPVNGVVPESAKQAARNDFLLKYPTVSAQLQGPVFQYFKGRSYPDAQSVYMQVFYPAYRDAHPTQVFPAAVQKQNPGIVTVADYVAKAEGRGSGLAKATGGALGLMVLGIGAYYLFSSSA